MGLKHVIKDNVKMFKETKLPFTNPKTGTTIWTADTKRGKAHMKGKRIAR